ncbi:hypothetical protein, partial [Candidatus Frankia nodulisporulans]|uniref:hypothetical protein n=1 Tax=Candidatus Frankia nodulisporulans TaxID=2060052 RepID=UPI001CDBBD7D
MRIAARGWIVARQWGDQVDLDVSRNIRLFRISITTTGREQGATEQRSYWYACSSKTVDHHAPRPLVRAGQSYSDVRR